MMRADAVVTTISAMLHQRRALLEDGALSGILVEVKLEKDGTVRVVLFTPTFEHGRSPGRTVALGAAMLATLMARRDLLDDNELRGVVLDARFERDRKIRVYFLPTYMRQAASVGLRPASVEA